MPQGTDQDIREGWEGKVKNESDSKRNNVAVLLELPLYKTCIPPPPKLVTFLILRAKRQGGQQSVSLKFYFCLNPEGQRVGRSLCVWVLRWTAWREPVATGPLCQGVQDPWQQARSHLQMQFWMQITVRFENNGIWKIGPTSTLFHVHRCSEPLRCPSEGWGKNRDLTFLWCCSGSMAGTEVTCSRCSVNISWISGCWNAMGQVLLGDWHLCLI